MAQTTTNVLPKPTKSSSPDDSSTSTPPFSGHKKRGSVDATNKDNGSKKPVKRRATKACAACRARKVRCDVMQRYHISANGEVTCSNCTMDGIKCVIEESRRKKKHLHNIAQPAVAQVKTQPSWGNGIVTPTDVLHPDTRRWSGSTAGEDNNNLSGSHVPHAIYQNASRTAQGTSLVSRPSFSYGGFDTTDMADSLLSSASIHGDRMKTQIANSIPPPMPSLKHVLPAYLKPLPKKMTSIDIDYMWAKGALSLPDNAIRNALLHSYVEYVHPYMPLVDIQETLDIIHQGDGTSGQLSLLLFQAILFAGTAFVEMDFLRQAGFTNRKSARKAFFQKARVLYDFDYESDRLSLVQSLLLMTYWYETPDDQKDTWHWMGVAISLAHTIGLHRDPEHSNMPPHKKKLWRRIWWSCFMRDRLVALGMRRPTRVKDGDYDVKMLAVTDFDLGELSAENNVIPTNSMLRDRDTQLRLAQMCIAKAKLCLCISHVLAAQYSVLVRHQGMGIDGIQESNPGIMLFPKKLNQTDEVRRCDAELEEWMAELPISCAYSDQTPRGSSPSSVFVQRSLLHMIYYTTLSALHRPQVLPSTGSHQPDWSRELQEISRKKVREASKEITRISQDLYVRGYEKYLPTTGVTVLLPAIIIHLLDIKSANDEARQLAVDGFKACIRVLENLRENYSSADYATQFLEAAIRKADIEGLMARNEGSKIPRGPSRRGTPPPELYQVQEPGPVQPVDDYDTPPDSNSTPPVSFPLLDPTTNYQDIDMNDFLNLDQNNDLWNFPLEEGAHGESGGFADDMCWVQQPADVAGSRLNSPGPGMSDFMLGSGV